MRRVRSVREQRAEKKKGEEFAAFREPEERVAIGRVDLSAIANRVESVCKCVSACKKRATAAIEPCLQQRVAIKRTDARSEARE